jgi:hypothetical protein
MTDPDDPLPDERFEPVARALDRVGRLRREVLAEAAQLGSVPGQERFRAAALAGMPRAGRAAVAAPAWRGRRWLAVAGILLVASTALWWFRSSGGGAGASQDHTLGTSVQLLEPVGAAASFARFRWLPGPFAGGYFEVLVHDEESGALVRRSGSRDEAEWLLSAAEEAQLPERIRWEVQPFDASGRPGRPASAQASRSR